MKTLRTAGRSPGHIPLALVIALALAAPVVATLATSGPAAAQGGFFGSTKSGSEDGQLAVRLGQLEEQVRQLTGQIEELNHQLRQTQDQLRRAQEDNEFRFQELEGGKPGTGKRSEAPAAASPSTATASTDSYGSAPAPRATDPNDPYAAKRDATVRDLGSYSVTEPGSGNPAANDPNVTLGPSGQPLDLSALARGNSGSYASGGYEEPDNPPVSGNANDNGVPGVRGGDDAIGQLAAASPGGSARQEYDEAYSMVLNGQYDQAAGRFQQFLAAYPDDPLAANAQYWLGESYFGKGRYREAADAFLKTYTDYPANDKAPDSLLKLGLSLSGLGQKDAACATYSELLTKYPGASGAVLNQARKEQKSAGCRG